MSDISDGNDTVKTLGQTVTAGSLKAVISIHVHDDWKPKEIYLQQTFQGE
jgi:hypothetical protein